MFPRAFIVLLFTQLAFASPSPNASNANANTSDYNPFHLIARKAPPKPSHPICCLKPQSSDSSEDDVLLLSFEEWKAKQVQLQEKEDEGGYSRDASRNESGANSGSGEWNGSSQIHGGESRTPLPSNTQDSDTFVEELSPHFRVPLTDRFNYASMDCSARIHASHRSAKSSSSILSSKRDKYMLSPCAEEKQFVIVELCEDIRIDTVQLANFEFFSGVFKDFEVSVAKTYTTDPEGWVDAGRYRAKNIRGVQSFHPPTSLRDFYRFIRIDFYSHYGNEYYCPVSLLRVYGLTHLEQWKWDMWEAESRARSVGPGDKAVGVVVVQKQAQTQTQTQHREEDKTSEAVTEVADAAASTMNVAALTEISPSSSSVHISVPETPASSVAVSEATDSTSTSILTTTASEHIAVLSTGVPPDLTTANDDHDAINNDTTISPLHSTDTYKSMSSSHVELVTTTLLQAATPISQPTDGAPASAKESNEPSASGDAPNQVPPDSSTTTTQTQTTFASVPISSLSSTSSTIVTASTPIHHAPPPPPHSTNPFISGGGESIYRTIMNRLTALESNHTLYTRYVEDQIGGIREVLRRLSEDVGRLEGIGKGQAQMYTRTMKEWEKHRTRMDSEYTELLHRVNYLTDEVILEKRLGIAQLCLLLAVLVFMGLTRGSRTSEADLQSLLAQRIAERERKNREREREMERDMRGVGRERNFRGSVREWGRRHLSSISGDWVIPFARSRSSGSERALGDVMRKEEYEEKENVNPRQEQNLFKNGQVEFPTLKPQTQTQSQSQPRRRVHSKPRSRTPSLRTPLSVSRHHLAHYYLPNSPTGPRSSRPLVQRANSQGDGVVIPMAGSWSGSMGRDGIPGGRSAKRLARSAHLHEVKIRQQGGKRIGDEKERPNLENQDNGEETASNDRQVESVDVFSSPPSTTTKLNRPLFGSRSLLVYPGAGLVGNADGEGDTDGWVDTDTNGSVDGDEESSSDVSITVGGNGVEDGLW